MLRDEESFPRLTELPGYAYEYREGLRLGDWERVLESIRGFRQVRVDLVPPYMAGAEALGEHAAALGAEAFPMGAGGGGSVLVFAPDREVLDTLRPKLTGMWDEIPFRLMSKGHEFVNCLSRPTGREASWRGPSVSVSELLGRDTRSGRGRPGPLPPPLPTRSSAG